MALLAFQRGREIVVESVLQIQVPCCTLSSQTVVAGWPARGARAAMATIFMALGPAWAAQNGEGTGPHTLLRTAQRYNEPAEPRSDSCNDRPLRAHWNQPAPGRTAGLEVAGVVPCWLGVVRGLVEL